MLKTFTYNGISSADFGILIGSNPKPSRPARKFSVANVAGRNGNLYDIQDAWEEVTQEYQILAGIHMKDTASELFYRIFDWLNSADGYAELKDDYDPTHYRLAVCLDATEVVTGLEKFGKTTIRFRCRPERFLNSQKNITLTFDSNGEATIYNPTKHIAKPLITVSRGTSTGTLRFNYVCVDLAGTTMIPNTAYINCENENIYGADGTNLNPSSKVYPFGYNEDYGFLRLESGANTIVKSGGIGTVTLDTRFWEI